MHYTQQYTAILCFTITFVSCIQSAENNHIKDKYLSGANIARVADFEDAFITGDATRVQQMIANKKIRIADMGHIFIDNHLFNINKKTSPCIRAIVEHDPYAVWKAYCEACKDASKKSDDHFASVSNRGHLSLDFIKCCLDNGFIIPHKRYEGSTVINGSFKSDYVPILHYLVAATPERENIGKVDTLIKQLLQAGANPYYTVACPILIQKETEKRTPIDVFTLIRTKQEGDRQIMLMNLCVQYVENSGNTMDQFYPNTRFYKRAQRKR